MGLKRKTSNGKIIKSPTGLKRCSCCGVCECGEAPCFNQQTIEFGYQWANGVTEDLFLRDADCCCDFELASYSHVQRMTIVALSPGPPGTPTVCQQVITGAAGPGEALFLNFKVYEDGVLVFEEDLESGFACVAQGPVVGNEGCRHFVPIGSGDGAWVHTCRRDYGWGVERTATLLKTIQWDTRLIADDDCLDHCGACCHPEGFCFLTSADGCAAVGGDYYPAAECADEEVPCFEEEEGACCLDGDCTQTTREDCEADPGAIYFGDGVPCPSIVCPDAAWACCHPDKTCSLETESDCAAITGRWFPNETCDDVDCGVPVTGACCTPDGGTCTQETEEDCIDLGREYHGDNTDCASSPCTGACCSRATTHSPWICSLETASGCAALNFGTFYGWGSTCGSVNCGIADQGEGGSGSGAFL